MFAITSGGERRCGVRWQRGQRNEDRFMNASRRMAVPQRGQGSPSRPYAARARSK